MQTLVGNFSVAKPIRSINFELYFKGHKCGVITKKMAHIPEMGLSLQDTIDLTTIYQNCLKWFSLYKPHEYGSHCVINEAFCQTTTLQLLKYKK